MKVLVINCGSSSVKYQVVESDSGERLAAGVVERIGEEGRTHSAAVKEIVEATKEHGVEAVGHRVVHGGPKFHDATLVDDEVKAAIEACVPLAPLHNPANLAGLEAARAALPDVPHVAVFDTAFHARMPRRAATYAIDRELAEKHQLRRYGFHGTSHAFVARLAAEHLGGDLRDFRIITLHLGNGASACAVEYGSSVETSMGLTPLEGLVMGTRSGDVDPGLVLKLARELGVDETDRVLNRESGLKGLSGLSNDLRDLQAKAAEGHDGARLAINVFAHQARKYIGAYATVMGGVDAIVLTAGIGENSADMRRRILQRLEFLGVRLDEEKNFDAKVSDDDPVRDIGAANARVRTLVIATNEELEIARQTAAQVQGAKTIAVKKPIPIAVSARHVHLTRESLDVLFGEGYELTPYKPLSQPGQFAAEEKVNLIGPRAHRRGAHPRPAPARQPDRDLAHGRVQARRGRAGAALGQGEELGADHARGAEGHAAPRGGADLRLAAHPHDARRRGGLRREGQGVRGGRDQGRPAGPDLRRRAGPGEGQLRARDAHRHGRGERRRARAHLRGRHRLHGRLRRGDAGRGGDPEQVAGGVSAG